MQESRCSWKMRRKFWSHQFRLRSWCDPTFKIPTYKMEPEILARDRKAASSRQSSSRVRSSWRYLKVSDVRSLRALAIAAQGKKRTIMREDDYETHEASSRLTCETGQGTLERGTSKSRIHLWSCGIPGCRLSSGISVSHCRPVLNIIESRVYYTANSEIQMRKPELSLLRFRDQWLMIRAARFLRATKPRSCEPGRSSLNV